MTDRRHDRDYFSNTEYGWDMISKDDQKVYHPNRKTREVDVMNRPQNDHWKRFRVKTERCTPLTPGTGNPVLQSW